MSRDLRSQFSKHDFHIFSEKQIPLSQGTPDDVWRRDREGNGMEAPLEKRLGFTLPMCAPASHPTKIPRCLLRPSHWWRGSRALPVSSCDLAWHRVARWQRHLG